MNTDLAEDLPESARMLCAACLYSHLILGGDGKVLFQDRNLGSLFILCGGTDILNSELHLLWLL